MTVLSAETSTDIILAVKKKNIDWKRHVEQMWNMHIILDQISR
jgi:hypothetical protein